MPSPHPRVEVQILFIGIVAGYWLQLLVNEYRNEQYPMIIYLYSESSQIAINSISLRGLAALDQNIMITVPDSE